MTKDVTAYGSGIVLASLAAYLDGDTAYVEHHAPAMRNELIRRLTRVVSMHYTIDGIACIECADPWPCDTNRVALGGHPRVGDDEPTTEIITDDMLNDDDVPAADEPIDPDKQEAAQ